MAVPPDPAIDLTFLDSPTEREERRRQAVAKALEYAQRTSALADDLLAGKAYSGSPQAQQAAPLVASAACQAWAAVARLLDRRAWQEP